MASSELKQNSTFWNSSACFELDPGVSSRLRVLNFYEVFAYFTCRLSFYLSWITRFMRPFWREKSFGTQIWVLPLVWISSELYKTLKVSSAALFHIKGANVLQRVWPSAAYSRATYNDDYTLLVFRRENWSIYQVPWSTIRIPTTMGKYIESFIRSL